MRANNSIPIQAKDIVELIIEKKWEENIKTPPPNLLGIDKLEFWEIFREQFFLIHGKQFIWGDENSVVMQNLNALLYYFLRDPDFFNCMNIRSDLSIPSFNKGLFIVGGYGVGKTAIMQVFESIFSSFPPYRFRIISTNKLVVDYESCEKPEDKNYFYESMTSGKRMFDDFTSENVASNFGQKDIMKKVIEERYDKHSLSHFTLNYAPGHEGNVESTLLAINQRYGGRVHERLIDMCNIVVFDGKSMRR